MRHLALILFASCWIACGGCKPEPPVGPLPTPDPDPVAVTKTRSTKLYMHYMPWFHSKDYSGYWGIHWRMANKNPENILPNGQREIAAHYYPLIGPYDSRDPDLIDYHLLLMKYAGVDGVLIDWYGSHDVLDYGENGENAEALVEGIKRVGLKYAMVYEEFTAEEAGRRTGLTPLDAAKADLRYLDQRHFSQDAYIDLNSKPLLLTFGPRFFNDPADWGQILTEPSQRPTFLPLWNHTNKVGAANAQGEFSWVDFNPSLSSLHSFYQRSSLIIGSAYPGFHDYYEQGGWGDSYGNLDHADGQTLRNTLAKAEDLPYLQLVTWNDFGEGTIFEPTAEFGFDYLEILQEFAGVSLGVDPLETIHAYYLARKAQAGNAAAQETLDDVFHALNTLEVARADSLLQQL